ncbi:putative DNA polymerase, partial [Stegodyphus mimosarum]
MATLREKTEETTRKLRTQGFHVIEMWEHEFQREKEENPDLQAFLDQHHLRDRLNPRESFFGGRTNALKLFHEGDAKYVDFTSLYPWVNKYCVYPVGHPTIITESFGDVEDYFGIIQCRVIPPRNLYLPVLPYRCRKKLMFPLCRTCALLQLQTPCTHTDDERALVGTWVTEEVKLAKKKGYRITHIYEVYHFQASTTSLFRSYIDLFLKIKQESSGWPSDRVTSEARLQYIRQYEERASSSRPKKYRKTLVVDLPN